MKYQFITAFIATYLVSETFASCAALKAYLLRLAGVAPDQQNAAVTDFLTAHANAACIATFLQNGGGNDFASEQDAVEAVNRVPSAVQKFADNPGSFLQAWHSDNIQYFSAENLKKFVSHSTRSAEHCMVLEDNATDHILQTAAKSKVVSSKCFAQLDGARDPGANGITKFSDDILIHRTKPLTHANFYNMKPKQLENYASSTALKATRCREGFHLQHLSKELISKVPADCLTNWLEYNSDAFTAEKVGAIKADQLKKGKLTAQGAKNLERVITGHQAKLHKDVVNFLASKPMFSHILEPAAIQSGMKIKKEAFTAMKPKAKVVVLEIVKDLPDDILEDVLPSEIHNFDNSDVARSDKKHCEGYACLNLLEKRKNVKEILAKLNIYHCMDRTLASLRPAKIFTKYMSRACFKECEDARTLHDYEDIDENVYKYISVEVVKDAFKDDWKVHAEDYIKIRNKKDKNSIWRGVFSNPKVCRKIIKLKTFKAIRKAKLSKALSAFSSECCRAMRFFSKVDGEDLKDIGPHVYSAFTKSDRSKINLEKASPEQIARISSDVTDLSNHYASQVSAEAFSAYSTDLVAILPEAWFRALPAESYAGISHEQFEVVIAENTANITPDKIEKLSEEVLKQLSPEQISLIGSGTNQEAEVLAILEKQVGSYNDDQKKAFNTRKDAGAVSGAVSLAVASLISFTVGLSLLIPLL